MQSNKSIDPKLLRRLKIVIIILIILAVLGITYRIIHYFIVKSATEKNAVLKVATIQAKQSPKQVEIVLPANIEAWHAATIYARTNGYLVTWKVDIGSKVKQGDLLAEISTPEVNAQLRQAEADLITAKANYYYAQVSAKRWLNLLKTDSVSQQETDEKVSAEKATAAVVASTQANRDRLKDLVSFERITAPFDGVIMSRTTDIGRLINAGSGPVPLFRLVQTDPLRVYVKVPEYFSHNIVPGLTAELFLPRYPEKSFTAELIGNASAIDLQTRTLLIQLKVNNPEGKLLAGNYAEIRLKLPAINSVVLPVNSLIFRAQGMQAAVIDDDHKATFKSIKIGQDFGDTVEVVSGVKPNETVILNPPDSLINGQEVQIISKNADMNK